MMRSVSETSQNAAENGQDSSVERDQEGIPNASQRNTPAAFLVLHHPGNPFVKSSPFSLALGSLFASLHPGCVNADIVTMKLVKRELNKLGPI